MRIAVISDIHGNLPALRAVLDDIRHRGCDAIANLGDLASGPLWPAETMGLLMDLPAVTIRGNHERQLLEGDPAAMGESDRLTHAVLTPAQLAWMAALPDQARIDGEVLLLHGTPASDVGNLSERVDRDGARAARPDELAADLAGIDARVVLCGHTHVPRVIELEDGRLCVNPGSVGLQAFRGRAPHPHVMQSGTPAARYAMLQRDSGTWHARLLAVEHDPAPAAELARDRGFDEWADALRDGRLPP
ncbi:metallophosphoesterase family protein [Luteimonas kalidii]|jgi:putative phosphoesterase|uniref:Metallophosphoesterase family protein n=1 Tax=Luteimonas kalidii TaxID=3042025 RepID=A0ABT6JTW6_9GAMM|nr:metallophosphoesterase family protein [Luteimonas kalidii]MDH5834123.1 metallophosphoesterase family protein [Luteimonas kalidii]